MNSKHKLLDEKNTEYVAGRYQNRIREKGVGFESMNSGTQEKQGIRHSLHSGIIRDGMRVVDFGCGIGQFLESLNEKRIKVDYVGVDIVPEYLDHCRQKFPGAQFIHTDRYFDLLGEFHPDVVVASQVFNAKYRDRDNAEVVRDFLSRTLANTRHAVSVDFLTKYVDFTYPDIFYHSPEEYFAFAKGLTRLVSLRHDYLPFEFSLQLFKENAKTG